MKRVLITLASLACSAPFVTAQTGAVSSDPPTEAFLLSHEDSELTRLEASYAIQLIDARRALGEKYLVALKNLQQDLTDRQRIEQALLVKMERERITELLDSAAELSVPTAGARPATLTELSPQTARCSGGPLFDEKREHIRNWTAAGGSALWDLDAEMAPGRYEVIVKFGAGRDAGGTFQVTVGSQAPLRGSIETLDTNGWGETQTMLAGTIAIGPESRTLSVLCDSLRQPYLWTLKGVTLAPVGTWQQMEADRITEADGSSTKDKLPTEPLGTLQTLKGARLGTGESPNTAHSFHVIHEGKRMHLRLYGVDSPYTGDPTDREYQGEIRRAFRGADPTIANETAGRAWLFTRSLLSTKPFNVYTYAESAPPIDGRVHAFIAVDGRTLGEALVENGFATTVRMNAQALLPDDGKPRDYQKKLRTLESAARAKGIGIWQKPAQKEAE